LTLADGRIAHPDRLVIACGAWSKKLAAQLGDKIPLDTERGYNITIPEPGVAVNRFVMLPGHGFVLSPLSTGIAGRRSCRVRRIGFTGKLEARGCHGCQSAALLSGSQDRRWQALDGLPSLYSRQSACDWCRAAGGWGLLRLRSCPSWADGSGGDRGDDHRHDRRRNAIGRPELRSAPTGFDKNRKSYFRFLFMAAARAAAIALFPPSLPEDF
jgi:hypothetical protein